MIAIKKTDLKPSEKPIQYAMVFDYYEEDHQGISNKIWGKQWKYLIVGSEIRPLVTPFDPDDVSVTNKIYSDAQWKGDILPDDEAEIIRRGLLDNDLSAAGEEIPVDVAAPSQEDLGNHKYGSSGESAEHRLLKEFISNNPSEIGLYNPNLTGSMEYMLPSLDSIDILFEDEKEWIAVEVKSIRSGKEDLKRGLYQCIKYRALMRAVERVSGSARPGKAMLALEGVLPRDLMQINNVLNIPVIERIVVK